jgi:hypothetical protein
MRFSWHLRLARYERVSLGAERVLGGPLANLRTTGEYVCGMSPMGPCGQMVVDGGYSRRRILLEVMKTRAGSGKRPAAVSSSGPPTASRRERSI